MEKSKAERMALAVNSLRDAQIARARMGLLNPMGLDNKRPRAWCEYGWPDHVSDADLFSLYRRGGLAHGAVNKVAGLCWKTNPWLIEGDEQDESSKETAWERKTKRTLNARIWRAFADADRRRLAMRYSALLLHVRDNKKWHEPVVKGRGLAKVTAVWSSSLKVPEWDTNENSQTYGQPLKWQYTEATVSGQPGRVVTVHPDRIFILGDYSADAIGWLEPAYNAFTSIEKVEGGSGESYLKNAARQMAVNFDKEIDLKAVAAAYGLDDGDIAQVLNDAAREVNSANDLMMILQGAQVTPLVANVPDPSPTYNINLQTISAALDIPSRVLVGNQQGERASTEDQRYFNATCQSRRMDLSFEIEDFADHLTRLGILDVAAEKTVMWDDLNEQTSSEKLDSAKKMSEINSTAIATGRTVFDSDEIRTAAGYDPNGGIPLGEDDEEEDGDENPSGDPAE